MTTFSAKSHEVKRGWFVIDATNKTLGRMSTEIARRLRGKHKAEYTPHVDTGDYIVVINTDKLHVTGNKMADKMYYKHTGYIGNLKSINLEDLMAKDSTLVVAKSVKGMMPKGPLGREMLRKLKLYSGGGHPHASQNPQALEL